MEEHQGQVVCPDCGMKFNTTEEHDKHHKDVHEGQAPLELTCAGCGFVAKSEAEMDEHTKTHSGGEKI